MGDVSLAQGNHTRLTIGYQHLVTGLVADPPGRTDHIAGHGHSPLTTPQHPVDIRTGSRGLVHLLPALLKGGNQIA